MFFKKENLYLFLALILIISTNVYLTCRLIPKKEGFNVKKEIDKQLKNAIKQVEKTFVDKLPNLIKDLVFKQPINAIPYKPLRKFFLDDINFEKDLGSVILQILFTIGKAILILLIVIPLIYYMITTNALPMIINAIISTFRIIIRILFTPLMYASPTLTGNSISGRFEGSTPSYIRTGKSRAIPSYIINKQQPGLQHNNPSDIRPKQQQPVSRPPSRSNFYNGTDDSYYLSFDD